MWAGPIENILYIRHKVLQYRINPNEQESINLITPLSKYIFTILVELTITQSANTIGAYIFAKSFIFTPNTCFQKNMYITTTVVLATSNDIITPDTPILGGRVKRKANNVTALTTSQITLYLGLLME